MERAAFLVEPSGQRIDCLLNPESLTVTRSAGIRPAGGAAGRLTGAGLADDPVHLTGGGQTRLELDLLFDVELVTTPGTTPTVTDVRALTRPFWQMAENSSVQDGTIRPPLVRFVWGKSWNVPGLVTAVAERFDRFDSTGVPLRSWLRMRFLRVADTQSQAEDERDALVARAQADRAAEALAALPPGTDPTSAVVVLGAGQRDGEPAPVRFDLLATDALGNPLLWRLLAEYNDIADPLAVEAGTVLAVPPTVTPGTGAAGSTAPFAASPADTAATTGPAFTGEAGR